MNILYFLLFLVVMTCPDLYIYNMYVSGIVASPLQLAWWLPSVATLASFGCAALGWYHNTFMRLFFGLTLFFVIPKLLFTAFEPWAGWQVGLVVAALAVLTLLYGFFFGWRRIVVRTTECRNGNLPKEFDGYRILQLSDIHVGTFLQSTSFIRKIVRVANAQKADVIVFTGDLVNVSATELLPFLTIFDKLSARDGVYSVMGNHDYCEYGHDHSERNVERNQHVLVYLEEKMGWHMLMNEHVMLQRNGAEIALIGVENIGRPPFKAHGNLKKAMVGLTSPCFKVLLSHDPTHWRRGVLHQTDIQLTLSGHTHAGQFKLGKFSPAKWAYNEWGGKYVEDGRMLYVSLGIGGTVPFRLGAWPEINVITLRS